METIKAVYTGDSKRYHKFEIVDKEKTVVGSIYFSKEGKISPNLNIETVSEGHPEYKIALRNLLIQKGQ